MLGIRTINAKHQRYTHEEGVVPPPPPADSDLVCEKPERFDRGLSAPTGYIHYIHRVNSLPVPPPTVEV